MSENHASTHLSSPDRRPKVLLDGRLIRWLTPVLLVLIALTMVSLHVGSYPKVGPIDELQHIDYLYKSPSAVAPGERVGQEAMREEACRGLYHRFRLPACSTTSHYNPNVFQEQGYNTAYINTPLYYSITHLFASAIQRVTGFKNLVTAGRLVGGLWLAAGLVIAYFAGLRLGAARLPLASVLVITACIPAVVYPSSTVTPDAATFAVGAAALWSVLWWEERPQRRWPILVTITTIALCIKMTNIVVLVALGVYMMLRMFNGITSREPIPPKQSARTWLTGGALLAGTALVVGLAWTAAMNSMGDASQIPMNRRYSVTSLPVAPLFRYLGNWVLPVSNNWTGEGHPELETLLQRIGPLLLSAGMIAAALFGVIPSRARSVAWSWLLIAFFGASAFIVTGYVYQSVYVPPPARYGYTLVPAMAALTSMGIRTRPACAVVMILAIASVILSIARLT